MVDRVSQMVDRVSQMVDRVSQMVDSLTIRMLDTIEDDCCWD